MGVEVVHDQAHLDRVGVTLVEHSLDEASPVLPGAARGHLDMAAAGQRFDLHKQRGDAVAHVFVVDDLRTAGGGGDRHPDLTDQLLARLVHADDRKAGIMRQTIDRQHVLHRGDKHRVPVRRDLPVFAQMRTQFVFFSDRCTVMVEIWFTIFSSTSLSASNRTVQRR